MPPDQQLPTVGAEIGADVAGFTGGMDAAIRSVSTFRGAIGATTGALAVFAGASGLGAALREAVKFERQTAELAKLVGEEQARPLAESISDLGSRLPVAGDRLFEVAEAAARLGVRGERNLARFTETAAKVGVATDLSSDQAADAFARIAAMTRTPISEMENMGSAANELSNTMATSFSEIINSTRRGGAELTALGLRVDEIFALAASLNEVSESAERSGTRLRSLAQQLQDPRETQALARALGMTVEEFKAVRQEAPIDIILGLAQVMRTGGERAELLRGELDQISQSVLTALGQNLDSTTRALERSNQAFREATSLTEEYSRFAETAAASEQLLQNQIDNLQRTIGRDLLPVWKDLLQTASETVQFWTRVAGTPLENVLPEREAERFLELLKEIGKAAGDSVRDLADIRGVEEEIAISARVLPPRVRPQFFAQVEQVLEQAAAKGESVGTVLTRVSQVFLAAARTAAVFGEETSGATDGLDDLGDGLTAVNEEVDNFIENLELEKKALESGERAALQKKLELMGATEQQIEYALSIWDTIEALERERDAERRRREELRRSWEQNREQTRREIERAEQAALGFVASVDLARVQQEMRQTERAAEGMAGGVGDAFLELITLSEDLGDAVADMVEQISREFARLAAQRYVIEPLIGWFLNLLGGGIPEAPPAVPGPEELPVPTAAPLGSLMPRLPAGAAGAAGGATSPTVVVQQGITFAPQMTDAASGAAFLQRHSPTIVRIVGEGARESLSFAREVLGEMG